MAAPYDFKAIEPEVIKFWEENNIYQKAKDKNKGKKPFYFLQGPPYSNGRIHIGHAWNNSMKDFALRYKRMRGFDVWDRAGYDMHGLPTENAIQKKLGLKTKDDIIKYGMEKFILECIKFSSDNALLMDKDLWRLGIWMDYKNAYWPLKNSFIEGEWWLIKQAHKAKRLYKGLKVMTWCQHCETALAKHELEYENVKDDSIFLKFKVTGKQDEYLIVWTTTPWTIPFNLGVMVNPELEYQRCKTANGETWIVSKALASAVIASLTGKPFEVIEEFKGSKLEGIHYEHPLLDKIPAFKELAKKHKNLHTVLLSEEYVDTSAGTGLVHSAPGCGPEDFEVGQKYGLPPFNELDERGIFHNMGAFDKLAAKIDDAKFVETLKESGCLLDVVPEEHEYPHCWRCHKPVVFRTTEQWFLKVEDLREKMLDDNKKIKWVPKRGQEAFGSWMNSLKDNSITRQRFWGAPVPIWLCNKCKNQVVIGTSEELKQMGAKNIPADLHKPWIDECIIPCKCSGEMHRIPDVLDVWIDSGTASWNCLDYPVNQELFKKLYPPDFVLEATEQVRLWFSMLLICSEVALKKSCLDNIYMHGMILDYQGMKMSKSLGNIISPYEVIDKYGADLIRYYMGGTAAGENINFSWDDAKNKHRNLIVLWNVHNYLLELAGELGVNPAELSKPKLGIEEKYMLSRLNSTIAKATELFESYQLDRIPWLVEELFLDLSRNYIQMVRDKVALGSDAEKKAVLFTIYTSMMGVLKLLAPVCPFIADKIYLDFRAKWPMEQESIHLFDWPKPQNKLVDSGLESAFATARDVVASAAAVREKIGINLRWPVASVDIITEDEGVIKELELLKEVIAKQANAKNVTIQKILKIENFHVEMPFRNGKVYVNKERTPELEAEGFSREVMRKVQALRKTAGLQKEQEIKLTLAAPDSVLLWLKKWDRQIKERCGAKELFLSDKVPDAAKHKCEEKIKNETVSIGFDVV